MARVVSPSRIFIFQSLGPGVFVSDSSQEKLRVSWDQKRKFSIQYCVARSGHGRFRNQPENRCVILWAKRKEKWVELGVRVLVFLQPSASYFLFQVSAFLPCGKLEKAARTASALEFLCLNFASPFYKYVYSVLFRALQLLHHIPIYTQQQTPLAKVLCRFIPFWFILYQYKDNRKQSNKKDRMELNKCCQVFYLFLGNLCTK